MSWKLPRSYCTGLWVTWSSCRCPWPWQKGWASWPLVVPSNLNYSMIGLCHGRRLRVQGERREIGPSFYTEWPQGFLGGLSFGWNAHGLTTVGIFRAGGRKLHFPQLCHLRVMAHEEEQPTVIAAVWQYHSWMWLHGATFSIKGNQASLCWQGDFESRMLFSLM